MRSRTPESRPANDMTFRLIMRPLVAYLQPHVITTMIRILFDTYADGGRSAAVKSAPRASLGLTEGNMPSRASRGQVMLRVGSFQRMERSPAG